MSNDSKSDSKKIVPAALPPVEVAEVVDTDLDDVAGGCSADSCNGTCSSTTNTATHLRNME